MALYQLRTSKLQLHFPSKSKSQLQSPSIIIAKKGRNKESITDSKPPQMGNQRTPLQSLKHHTTTISHQPQRRGEFVQYLSLKATANKLPETANRWHQLYSLQKLIIGFSLLFWWFIEWTPESSVVLFQNREGWSDGSASSTATTMVGVRVQVKAEKPVLGKETVEESCEEVPENAVVAGTSPSISRALGMEDSHSFTKEALVDDIVENQSRKTFASLFADNKSPNKGIQLYKIEEQPDIVEVEPDEVDDVIALGDIHLLFMLPLVMKFMPSLFDFGSASFSILLNAKILAKICSKIGSSLYTNPLTGARNLFRLPTKSRGCRAVFGVESRRKFQYESTESEHKPDLNQGGIPALNQGKETQNFGMNHAQKTTITAGTVGSKEGQQQAPSEQEGRLFDIMKWKFKDWNAVHNFNLHERGLILIIWNPLLVSIDVLHFTSQVMYVSITCKVTSKTFLATFVHGLHSVMAHRPLWNSLVELGNNVHSPWLLVILSVSLVLMIDVDLRLIVLTLSVIISLGQIIMFGLRLSALCNQAWFDSSLEATVRFLPMVSRAPENCFMFFNIWYAHEDFLWLVDTGWMSRL
ncbi:hypothetical protein M9H77_30573 [Catharanthus roseus]|uniref:Uncharacterized protein n=1 Tax=Catharanthus roseus TaxID=4058 RepID=A0ACC0A1J5_CATRO|nr:hypothetical protein M9H77_30573 [Catharanthus roseus]